MILVVPTTSDAFYQQTTTFEGITYLLTFAYNQRVQSYYLSIADASGVDIYNGVKLICNMALLRKCSDPRKPHGELFVISSTNDATPPGLQDLVAGSGRCTLLYMTSDWLDQLRSPPEADNATIVANITSGTNAILATIANNTVNQTESTYGQE